MKSPKFWRPAFFFSTFFLSFIFPMIVSIPFLISLTLSHFLIETWKNRHKSKLPIRITLIFLLLENRWFRALLHEFSLQSLRSSDSTHLVRIKVCFLSSLIPIFYNLLSILILLIQQKQAEERYNAFFSSLPFYGFSLLAVSFLPMLPSCLLLHASIM